MTFANDTSTKLIGLDLNGIDAVEDFLDQIIGDTGRLADNVTSKTSKEARKKASRVEDRKLNLGEDSLKWVRGKGMQLGGTVWDSALGGYRSKRPHKNGYGLRMINFKYQDLAGSYTRGSLKNKTNVLGVSTTVMTSQIANLWENDAFYAKRSSIWKTKTGGYASQKAGVRPGKHYFQSAYATAVSSSVPQAKKEALDKFNADVAKADAKAQKSINRTAKKLGGTP